MIPPARLYFQCHHSHQSIPQSFMVFISKPHPLNSSNAYYMQSHHCYQCSLDFHHSDQRRGYTDHCCIGKLHFGRKLYKQYSKQCSDIASKQLLYAAEGIKW